MIQRDLAARAGVSERSVQDWEAGITLPTATRLQALIRALLHADGLTAGNETSDARALWMAAERDARRMHTPFDDNWFAGLLAAHAAPTATQLPDALPPVPPTHSPADTPDRAQDWGEAPDTLDFVGRAEELQLLSRWVLDERCRLVAVLGFGGIGKTSLAARLAQTVAPAFERVYWRSLRNAPPVSDWLAGAIGFLSDQQRVPPPSESERVTTLLQLLRARRCLLVLDNSEALFEPGQREGRYRAGMDGYGHLLQAIGETSHQSCLVLTSREAPPELPILGSGVRSLQLHGLGPADARALLADKQLNGDPQTWESLVGRYGGNGLALKIVSETIRQVYDSDIAAFLTDVIAGYGSVFGGIRRLLDVQAERLTPLERDMLTRLAIEREPVTLAELSRSMARNVGRNALVDAIEALRQRSLVERGEHGGSFTLQSMVLEYVTDRLVETAAEEISLGHPDVLVDQPLIKAQAKDYVRQTQERLIGGPILRHLNAQHAEAATNARLRALLDTWRGRPDAEQGYGPGNIVNLLRLLGGDLRELDLSHLHLRQVYLQAVDAQDTTLEGAHLAEAVLGEAFAYSTSISLSADGALLVAGTPTGEVRLWRIADSTLLMSAQAHADMVWSVALSGDGKLIATGGADGVVRLWDASGQLRVALQGHVGMVRSVALSSDGRLAASGGNDECVRVWDTVQGRLVAILEGNVGTVWSVALSADGQLVASGGVDGTPRVWETRNGRLLASPHGKGLVFAVALSADGRVLASGGADGAVRLWDAATGEPLVGLRQDQTSLVRCVALSADGELVASGHNDGAVRLWETASGRPLASPPTHAGVVWGVAFADHGRLLATTSDDGTIRLSDPSTAQLLASVQGDTSIVYGVGLSDDGRLAASGGTDRTVHLWDTDNGQLLATMPGNTGVVYGAAISSAGRLAAACGVEGTVRLWDAPSGRLRTELQENSFGVRAVVLSADEQLVVSSSAAGAARVWDVRSGQLLATLPGHVGIVLTVAVSPDGGMVASGGDDGLVVLWDIPSGHALATLRGHIGAVRAVALSGDGRLLASAGVDGIIRLWGTESRELIGTLEANAGAVYSVALSKNGRLAASAGIDGLVRLWEPSTGQLRATFRGHTGAVWGVALSGDGRVLASGGDDGILRVWDVFNGQCRLRLRRDRHYQRLEITGLTGITDAQRTALLALGAFETAPSRGAPAVAR